MRAIGKADGGRGSRNLLHGHAMREITEPGATPFLFDCNPQKAERPKLRPQLAGETVGPVDLIGARRDFLLRKVAHRIAKHFDIAAKAEIEAGQAVRQNRSLPGGAHRKSSPLKITAQTPDTKPARRAASQPVNHRFIRFYSSGRERPGLFTRR